MPRTRQHQALLAAAVAAALAGAVTAGVAVTRRRRKGGLQAAGSARAEATGVPVTQATVRVNPADAPMGQPGNNTEQRLDEAIQETFPASDPVSVRIE